MKEREGGRGRARARERERERARARERERENRTWAHAEPAYMQLMSYVYALQSLFFK